MRLMLHAGRRNPGQDRDQSGRDRLFYQHARRRLSQHSCSCCYAAAAASPTGSSTTAGQGGAWPPPSTQEQPHETHLSSGGGWLAPRSCRVMPGTRRHLRDVVRVRKSVSIACRGVVLSTMDAKECVATLLRVPRGETSDRPLRPPGHGGSDHLYISACCARFAGARAGVRASLFVADMITYGSHRHPRRALLRGR